MGRASSWGHAARRLAGALGAIVLLGLAACGGDGNAVKAPGCWHHVSNPLPPVGLHYARDAEVYALGRPVDANVPAHGGGPIDHYSVDPPLPQGLSLDPATGIVSGTPQVLAVPVVHAVTGSSACGTATTGLQIAVIAGDLAPEKLAFANPQAIYTVRRAIPPNHPSVEGGVVALYAVQPALPDGLSIDPASGVISGTPTRVSAAATFTVTASNGAGSASTVLTIEVRDEPAPPASIAYPVSSALYAAGRPIVPNVPQSTGGVATVFSIEPALPPGLSIDPASGVISGTPLAAQPATPYTVIAGNEAGVTSTQVVITVALAGSAAPSGAMGAARSNATASLLPDGRVLLAGGYDDAGALASAETYDPGSRTWTAAAPMSSARFFHAATFLDSGKVLVAGGENSTGSLAAAELYDPGSGQWTGTGAMAQARSGHSATLLPGGKVLVAGGYDGSSYLATAEVYDPATGAWTATASMGAVRTLHTATLLPDGRVLVAGGLGAGALAEIFDPATGTWTATGSMNTARLTHTAVRLPDGQVLVAGGYGGGGPLASAELYQPATGLWTPTGSLNTARIAHAASLLSGGQVLVAGGYDNGATLASAELYDLGTGLWVATGALGQARYFHTQTVLPDGLVLIAGGHEANALSAVELHVP